MKFRRYFVYLVCLAAPFICSSVPVQVSQESFPAYQSEPVDVRPIVEWVTFIGTASGSTIDANGNILLFTNRNLELRTDNKFSPGTDEVQVILTRITGSGQMELETSIDAGTRSWINSMEMDDDGSLYLAGYSREGWGNPTGPFSVGDPINSDVRLLIAKYGIDRSLLWNTFINPHPRDLTVTIALDESKNLYVSWGQAQAATCSLVKFDSEGILLWADDFGPSSQNVDEIYSYPVDIIPDQDGNIYVLSDSNARWGNPIRDFSGDWDGVLAKYDNNGGLLWNTFLGGPGEDGLSAVGIDQDGNIYVSGGGQTTWGTPLSPHTGTSAGFMAKLDPNGDLLWNTFIGSETGIVGINTFMVEEDGTLYLAGTSTTTWGNPFDAFAGNADGYIARMDSNGSLLWNTFIGGSGNEGIGYLAISNNILYIVGGSDSGFGNPINNPSGGDNDTFIVRMNLIPVSLTRYRDAGPLVPEITTHIPTPLDLSTDPEVIGTNVLFAVVLMLPFAVAVDTFSKLFSNNEENLKRWFPPITWIGGLQTKFRERVAKRVKQNQGLIDAMNLAGVAIFYGILFSLLDETWKPFTAQGLVLLISMTIAYGVIGISDDILQWRAIRRWGIPCEYDVRPTNVFLSAVSVGISRLLALLPGLMFGSPEAVKVDAKLLDKSQNQSLTRISAMTYVVIVFGAWLPTMGTAIIQQGTISDSARNILGGVQAFLLVIFAVALENVFIQLLDLSEGLGRKLKRINRLAWAAGLISTAFLFLHALFNPHYDLVESLEQGNAAVFIGVALVFILITIIIRLISWRIESGKTRISNM